MEHVEPISWDEHSAFTESLRGATDRYYALVQNERGDLGVVSLNDIDDRTGTAELGLYKNPELDRRGVGTQLLSVLEAIANIIGIHSLTLRVQRDNSAARGLYEKFEYSITSSDSSFLKMAKRIE